MGNFYTNITVQGTTQTRLLKFLSSRACVAFVASPKPKQHVVFHEQEDEPIASEISAEFDCVALWVSNEDDDVLHYALYRGGQLLDSRELLRSRNEIMPNLASGKGQGADAETSATTLAKVFRARREAIEQHLQADYVMACDLHAALVAALKLSPLAVGIGYRDIESGDVQSETPELNVRATPVRNTHQVFPPLPAFDEDDIRKGHRFFGEADCMRSFSLLGALALALRGGRRLQWQDAVRQSKPRSKKDAARIETALAAAEAICVSPGHTFKLADKAAMTEMNLEKDVPGGTAYDAQHWIDQPPIKHNAYLIVRAALQVIGADYFRDLPYPEQYKAYEDPAYYTAYVQEAWDLLLKAIQSGIPSYRDVERLRQTEDASGSEYGHPIDPSELGPLGDYWPTLSE
jgi:hypothetical protein